MTATALLMLLLLLNVSSLQPHEMLPFPMAWALYFLCLLSLSLTSLPILCLPTVRFLWQVVLHWNL